FVSSAQGIYTLQQSTLIESLSLSSVGIVGLVWPDSDRMTPIWPIGQPLLQWASNGARLAPIFQPITPSRVGLSRVGRHRASGRDEIQIAFRSKRLSLAHTISDVCA